jgi:hypothetical protein
MSSQDMTSEEQKQADMKMKEANFYNSLGSEDMSAETDAFQCGRCKQVGGCDFFLERFGVYLATFLFFFSARHVTINSRPVAPMSQ